MAISGSAGETVTKRNAELAARAATKTAVLAAPHDAAAIQDINAKIGDAAMELTWQGGGDFYKSKG